MMEYLKRNPIVTAGAVISSIVTILAAFWAVDSHYATAADLQNVENSFASQMVRNRTEDLDDRIFELELKKSQLKGKLDPIDDAMLERYKRNLRKLEASQNAIKKDEK